MNKKRLSVVDLNKRVPLMYPPDADFEQSDTLFDRTGDLSNSQHLHMTD